MKAERDRAIWAKDAISKHAQELERTWSELRSRMAVALKTDEVKP